MKYPQLVSPRAVNAISDWLVSRLEQLGVESPQIYTRLLLSLLQSSVQINDPIEFSNLEAFFSNRKGGNKRFHLPSDTETLKKLNAVHCLREIVSNEHETATIEKLIEELCEKLNDIEKQTQNLNDEERFLVESHLNSDSLQQSHTQLQHQQHCSNNNNPLHQTRHHKHHHHQQEQQVSHACNTTNNAAFNIGTTTTTNTTTTTTSTSDDFNDLDNDPKKRYFRAFPALSKEMEDSFRIWRRNAKSLTWPVVGRSIVVNNLNNSSASLSSSSASSTISSSNFGACSSVPTGKSIENKVSSDCVGNIVVSEAQQGTTAATSVKKKSKRRRNQAVCKGKNIQNIRKVSFGTASNSVGGANKYHHYTHHHRNSSSPAWDTDFKGCWEMGPDLIKEFIRSQNGHKHNRSNSDGIDQREQRERKLLYDVPTKNDDKPIMKSYIDLSFCCDDDDDDIGDKTQHQYRYTEEGIDYFDEDYDDNTLASMSELTMDNLNQKRLYQREGNTQKSLTFGDIVLIGNSAADKNLDDVGDSVDTLDFQQFKSKFNSSVEALWKDVAPTPTNGPQQSTAKIQNGENSLKLQNQLGGGGISSGFYATTSLNALAPFKRDLWNFWSNYQHKNYDQLNNKISTSASTSSMITTTHFDDSSASSGVGGDNTNSSDYFSMPSNLDDFDKSVGSVRRTTEPGGLFGPHTPSINVFLQNSIWSTSADSGGDVIGSHSVPTATETDESFLFRVWQSNKKLSEIDVGNAVSGNKVDNDGVNVINNDFKKSNEPSSFMMNNPNLGASLQFPSYQNLKWSEGINAGPPYGSLQTHAFVSHHNGMLSSLRADNNFASFGSVASISGGTWKAPTWGQNAQPDLGSWCACNPISLTEMYGNDVCDSIVNQSPVEEEAQHQSEMGMGPAVTLPNHSASSSGFVAYSRIKQCGIVQPQIKPLQTSTTSRLPKDFFRSSEEENLLTSERTHFHPIENFVDGHTFDISNDLDTVEFERTASGLMRYDSEEYLEYTRNDIYMADEEVSTSSTNLLKFSKKSVEDNSDMFIIKFRVKRSGETSCQTEEHDFKLAAAKMAEVSTAATTLGVFPSSFEVNNMFQNTFSLSRQANNEAIMAAVTKAVAAAAKAAAENHLNAGHFCWLPITSAVTNTTTNNTCTNTRETNLLWRPDSSIGDEVDFCKIDNSISRHQQQLAQSWSMQEVEKQCHQRNCFPQQEQQKEIENKVPPTSNQQRSEENSLDNTSVHTLWGMCAVCNSCEYGKSMPANRLLRDELHLEADEIMSDLRYMQDLYIGESDTLNETNEAQPTGEKDVAIDNKKDCYSKDMDINSLHNPWNKNKEENKAQLNDPAKASMLKKVNQLIEDLLKTENTGKQAKDSNEHDKIISQTQLSNFWNLQADQGKTKNLWQFVEQEHNNVWQHTALVEQFPLGSGQNKKEFVKPMNLLKQVGGSFSEDTQYMENLNWEHNNLAKIWQQSTPVQLEETLIKHKQNDMPSNHVRIFKEQEETIEGCQKLVNEKNLKNLQNSNNSTPPPNLPPNTYKRVQQLFNNSAAKMKLIANRKRRHSASQNFYQQQYLQYNTSGNGNNNDNITDLNGTLKPEEEDQEQPLQQHNQKIITPHNNTPLISCINSEEQQPAKQTIITCKYWTTATNGTQSSLDSAAAAMMLLAAATNTNNAGMITATATDNYDPEDSLLDENICSNTFSCLIDKNASILKHVTMMTRPLTR